MTDEELTKLLFGSAGDSGGTNTGEKPKCGVPSITDSMKKKDNGDPCDQKQYDAAKLSEEKACLVAAYTDWVEASNKTNAKCRKSVCRDTRQNNQEECCGGENAEGDGVLALNPSTKRFDSDGAECMDKYKNCQLAKMAIAASTTLRDADSVMSLEEFKETVKNAELPVWGCANKLATNYNELCNKNNCTTEGSTVTHDDESCRTQVCAMTESAATPQCLLTER